MRLGTHWVPARDVNAFLAQVLGAEEPRWSRTGNQFVRYVTQTAEWVFETDPVVPAARNFGDWGTPRASALSIVHDLLNGRVPKVIDELDDGRRVVNQQETLAAQEKGEALQRRFAEWLWGDADRAERLARDYNDTFNAVRPREYDGAHLSLPGSNPAFTLRPHQKAAVWRILQEPAVGLFHEVGAGKTTVMAAAAMELRRLGLARKVLLVVPNDILHQFAAEFQRFYPLARLLVPGKDDFTPARRNEFMARIATGDWDAVIVAQSQFTLLPVHPETEAAFLRRELAGYRDALGELADAAQEQGDRSWRSSEKSVQKAILRLSARLVACQRRLEERQRLTRTMTFEDLGIDRLFVDEAHGYKNLPFATRLERVKGLPNPAECQRASDMFLKTQWLLERGGGIVFATGTPIANTIAESWTMARYLMRERLDELGLQHFDAWAKLFAETVVTLEQTVTGAYRPTARFARFKNVPEWLQLFQIVADIRMGADVPELERLKPRLVGGQVPGKRIYRTAAATPELLAFMEQLGRRVESLGPPIKGGDNMLKIASDARKAALDMRLVMPGAPEPPSSKLNLAADEIASVYRETAAERGVQLVFLDLGTPKAVVVARDDDGVLVGTETADEVALLTDVYSDLKRKLTARGIPPNEVRFVHEVKTREARFGLFQAANEGRVRVIIGSTQKLGTGANVQKRLAALHHLDAPWRPMDIEQRDGRGLRQGNEVYGPVFDGAGSIVDPGKGIRIFLYVTESSFDGYIWQAIEAKARGFKAILRRSVTVRVIEDVDEVVLSAAEARALVAGDPDVLRRVQLQTELTKLQALRAAHLDRQVQARWELKRLPRRIAELRARVESIGADVAFRDTHAPRPNARGEKPFAILVDGRTYTDREEAAPPFAAAVARGAAAGNDTAGSTGAPAATPIARYRAFDVTVRPATFGTVRLGLRCPDRADALEYSTTRTLDLAMLEGYGTGLFQRLDHVLQALDAELRAAQDGLAREETNLASYTEQLDRHFEHEPALVAAQQELTRIERRLTGPATRSGASGSAATTADTVEAA